MLARGFDVRATDGSPEMAAVASRRLGRPVETLLFHDLDEVEAYDGVWANACLLHVPRAELADVLALIWRALKPGGDFYASYKAGDADGRDTLNRYYNYPSPDWLRANYAEAGNWSSLSIETGEVRGFDNKWAAMLFVVARKKAPDARLQASAAWRSDKMRSLGMSGKKDASAYCCCRCDRAGHWMGHGRPSEPVVGRQVAADLGMDISAVFAGNSIFDVDYGFVRAGSGQGIHPVWGTACDDRRHHCRRAGLRSAVQFDRPRVVLRSMGHPRHGRQRDVGHRHLHPAQ